MIPLTGTAHRIRVRTTSIANIDVMAAYAELESGLEPIIDYTITPISSIGTIDVLAGPAAGKRRTLKTMTARNRHATTANTITVLIFDGTNSAELTTVVLAAGEVLHYHEGAGFYVHDAQGRVKSNDAAGSAIAAVNSLNLVVLANDIVNNNAVANTIADVTGMTFPVTAGETYWFLFTLAYQSALITTGARFSINGPASPTRLSYTSNYALTATTTTLNSALAYDIPAAANASPANASALGGNIAQIEGTITPSATGNVTARFASEIASSAITVHRGSLLQWVRTL